MTSIHPFRDVNTRSQHVFFNQLARSAGWVIDWSEIPTDLFAHARTLAIVDDHLGIDALIRPRLLTVDEAAVRDGRNTSRHARKAQVRLTSRPPDVLSIPTQA